MLEIIFDLYWRGFIIAGILAVIVIYLIKEDFNDEGIGIFFLILIKSSVLSWYAVYYLVKELINISIEKNKKRKP